MTNGAGMYPGPDAPLHGKNVHSIAKCGGSNANRTVSIEQKKIVVGGCAFISLLTNGGLGRHIV